MDDNDDDGFERRILQAHLRHLPIFHDLERAMLLVDNNPDMGLAKCRQILETTLYELHRDSLGNPGTKRLEQLIADLARQGKLPRKVLALCEVVRELGNVGVHPIYDDEELSHREAQIALQALVIVLEWHSRSNCAALQAHDVTHTVQNAADVSLPQVLDVTICTIAGAGSALSQPKKRARQLPKRKAAKSGLKQQKLISPRDRVKAAGRTKVQTKQTISRRKKALKRPQGKQGGKKSAS